MDGYVRHGKKAWFKKENVHKKWTLADLLKDVFIRVPPWDSRQILSQLGNDFQVKSYLANIQKKHWDLVPYSIRVGTLHSSKGLGADVVFVFNNHTLKTENEILDKGQPVIDAETRLYYVGITRVKETCILVDNFFDTYTFDLGV
jgi:superfamily I DNA/RNA helicase